MLFWGLGLGLLAGFFLSGWAAGRGFFTAPFFQRLAQAQNSPQFDLRLMLEEMRQKTEDLAQNNRQLSLELQDLREKVLAVEGMFLAPAFSQGRVALADLQEEALFCPAAYSPREAGAKLKVLECRQEIFRLYQDGVSRPEIARQLKLGQGEVELVLSLKEKKHQE